MATQVLGIVFRAISGHLIRKAGLVLDGVYRREGEGRPRFVPIQAPSPAELQGLVQRIAERIGRSLERSGLITRHIENAYLAFDPAEESPINDLHGVSITYRIATGQARAPGALRLKAASRD